MYSDLIRAGRRGSEVHINSDLMPWAHVDDTDLSDSSFTLYALIRLGFTEEAGGKQFSPAFDDSVVVRCVETC